MALQAMLAVGHDKHNYTGKADGELHQVHHAAADRQRIGPLADDIVEQAIQGGNSTGLSGGENTAVDAAEDDDGHHQSPEGVLCAHANVFHIGAQYEMALRF